MAVTHKIAAAQQPLPLGWNYSYLNDGFTGPNGEFISRDMVQIHGSFHKAFAHMYGGQTGAIGAIHNGGYVTGANGSAGPFVTASSIQPAAEISVEGKLGRITINLNTGELKMPPNVGRDAAIRDFWLGFQEYWQPTNKVQYERKIMDLQQEVAQVKASAALMRKDDEKEAAKKVAEKVSKKYGNEKFIMIKPEDLIRFIEEA